MKVALAFPGCHRRGGVERIMYECAGFLATRGHDVTVFADEWEPDSRGVIRYERIAQRRWPAFLRGRSFFNASTRRLAEETYDILNTHGCVCPTGGVQWVQSVQRAWLEICKTLRPPLSYKRIRQRLNPLHPVLLQLEERHFRQRQYRKVIATTEIVKLDLGRYYDVPAEDVEVIPNGFSPAEFNPQHRFRRRDEMRSRLGIRPPDVALLFGANELDRKGFDTILGALARLRRPELKLLHVGRPTPAEVMSRARQHGLEGQVFAYGSTRDMAGFHAAADAFVLPTQYEAFCLAILEALGSGLPVVTSDVPGARDAIVPGVNGLLVSDPKNVDELAEALRSLLCEPIRAAMSAAAPVSVEQYQWPSVLQRYEQVLLDQVGVVSRISP